MQKIFSCLLGFFLIVSVAGTSHAYDEDMHFSMVYWMCKRLGYNDVAAFTVAFSNQLTDIHWATEPGASIVDAIPVFRKKHDILAVKRRLWHFPAWQGHTDFGVTSQNNKYGLYNILNSLENRTAPSKNHLSDSSMNPYFFGMSLHVYMDTWSHEGFEGNLGHAVIGYLPDRPHLFLTRTKYMLDHVFTALVEFTYKFNDARSRPLDIVPGWYVDSDKFQSEVSNKEGVVNDALSIIKEYNTKWDRGITPDRVAIDTVAGITGGINNKHAFVVGSRRAHWQLDRREGSKDLEDEKWRHLKNQNWDPVPAVPVGSTEQAKAWMNQNPSPEAKKRNGTRVDVGAINENFHITHADGTRNGQEGPNWEKLAYDLYDIPTELDDNIYEWAKDYGLSANDKGDTGSDIFALIPSKLTQLFNATGVVTGGLAWAADTGSPGKGKKENEFRYQKLFTTDFCKKVNDPDLPYGDKAALIRTIFIEYNDIIMSPFSFPEQYAKQVECSRTLVNSSAGLKVLVQLLAEQGAHFKDDAMKLLMRLDVSPAVKKSVFVPYLSSENKMVRLFSAWAAEIYELADTKQLVTIFDQAFKDEQKLSRENMEKDLSINNDSSIFFLPRSKKYIKNWEQYFKNGTPGEASLASAALFFIGTYGQEQTHVDLYTQKALTILQTGNGESGPEDHMEKYWQIRSHEDIDEAKYNSKRDQDNIKKLIDFLNQAIKEKKYEHMKSSAIALSTYSLEDRPSDEVLTALVDAFKNITSKELKAEVGYAFQELSGKSFDLTKKGLETFEEKARIWIKEKF